MDQAEKLRNIIKQQKRPRNVARVITVTSGKGGVGKTSIAVNLAIQLCRMKKRVIVLDADFGLANIEVMLGIRPQYSLADLMFRGKTIEEIITSGPEGIGFISGGSGIQELTSLTKEQIFYLTQKLFHLDEMADIIIIDTGAGIADSVLEFVAASSEVLLVATPEPTSITDAYALLKSLNRKEDFSIENTRIRLIANRISSEYEGNELHEKLNVVVQRFLNLPLEYLSGVPQDANVSKSIMKQTPLLLYNPSAPASKAIVELAGILCNGNENMKQEKKGIAQLFVNLLKSKNRKYFS